MSYSTCGRVDSVVMASASGSRDTVNPERAFLLSLVQRMQHVLNTQLHEDATLQQCTTPEFTAALIQMEQTLLPKASGSEVQPQPSISCDMPDALLGLIGRYLPLEEVHSSQFQSTAEILGELRLLSIDEQSMNQPLKMPMRGKKKSVLSGQ